MRLKLKIWLLVSCPNILFSQSEYGNALGNYLSTSSLRLNPASAAKMKAKWMICPITVNINLYNNMFQMDMPYSPYRLMTNSVPSQYLKENNKPFFDWNWIKVKNDAPYLNFSNINRMQGPSVLLKHQQFVFGIHQEFVTHTIARGFPSKILKEQLNYAHHDFESEDVEGIEGFDIMEQNNIYFNHHRYNSVNFLISRNFKLIKNQELSVGLTYKILSSFGGYHFGFQTSQYLNKNTNESKTLFAKMQLIEYEARNNKFRPYGIGGLDIGAQWIYHLPFNQRKSNYSKYHPEYKFRLGFSVLDIGNLIYTRTIINQLSIGNAFTGLNLDDIKNNPNLNNENALKDFFNSIFKLETTYGERVKVGLPTRMQFNTDFQFYKRFFINGLTVINLRKKMPKNHMSQPGFFLLTPRYETRDFEMGFPLMLRQELPKVSSGLYFRFLHFYIGTHQIKSLVNPQKASEVSLYVGFEISNYLGKFFNKKFTYMKTKRNTCSVF